MTKIQFPETTLIGLALKGSTTNENNQSAIDCGNLWQQFEKEDTMAKSLTKQDLKSWRYITIIRGIIRSLFLISLDAK